jgi:hypothetical protein
MSIFGSSPKGNVAKQGPAFNIPQAALGEPVPYLFGTQYMTGTCVYPVDAAHMISRKKSTGTGGKAGFGGGASTGASTWFLNFMIVYSCNPILKLHRIKIDDAVIWAALGGLPFDAETMPDGYVDLAQAKLSGVMRFYFGTDLDVPDPFLLENVDHAPAWPGFSKCFFEDFEVGTSPSVPKLKLLATATPQSPLDDSSKLINTGDFDEANLVHVIADLLTNTRYGAGMPVNKLDLESWNDAAAQLAREGVAGSSYLDKQDKCESLIDTLCDHIGGRPFKRGGLWMFKLIRKTYSYDDVPQIPEAQFADVKLTPPEVTTAVNQLVVSYKDHTREYADTPVVVPNVAHALATGYVNQQKIDRPFFTDFQVAVKAAQTEAPRIVNPPTTLAFAISRFAGFDKEWGDVFRPIWSRQGLDGTRVFRITKLERPLGDSYLKGEAAEEFIFVEGGFVNVDPPQPGTDPTGIEDVALTAELPLELPWDFSPDALRITHLAARRQQIYSDFQLIGSPITDVFDVLAADGLFVQAGTLAENYSATTLEVDDTGVIINAVLPADLAAYFATASVTRAELFYVKRLFIIGDPATGLHEICAFQIIEPAGTGYRVRGIIRGLSDTRPLSFASGTPCFLCSASFQLASGLPFTVPRQPGWGDGVTIHLKAVPYNNSDAANPSAMTTRNLLLQERSKRPFAVSSLMADGVGAAHGPMYAADATVRLSWIPHTRGAGCGYSNPAGIFDPAISVEGDFIIRIYAPDATTLLRSFIVAAGTTFTDGYGVARHYVDYTPASDSNPASFIVRATSRLDGWESLRSEQLTVTKL